MCAVHASSSLPLPFKIAVYGTEYSTEWLDTNDIQVDGSYIDDTLVSRFCTSNDDRTVYHRADILIKQPFTQMDNLKCKPQPTLFMFKRTKLLATNTFLDLRP